MGLWTIMSGENQNYILTMNSRRGDRRTATKLADFGAYFGGEGGIMKLRRNFLE
jgi:hypothetical protein